MQGSQTDTRTINVWINTTYDHYKMSLNYFFLSFIAYTLAIDSYAIIIVQLSVPYLDVQDKNYKQTELVI